MDQGSDWLSGAFFGWNEGMNGAGGGEGKFSASHGLLEFQAKWPRSW